MIPEWMDEALCAQVDTEVFFPPKGGSSAPARRVCAMCVVSAECLEYALRMDMRHGVWGGKSERQRRRMKSARQGTGMGDRGFGGQRGSEAGL